MVCCNAMVAKLAAMIVKTTLVYRSVVMVVSFVSVYYAVDRGMTITDVKLLEKHGGKSGSFVNG